MSDKTIPPYQIAVRPTGYPPIKINFDGFKKILNTSMVNPFDDEEELNYLYMCYKQRQYSLRLEYVRKSGYETVFHWAQFFFMDWTMDNNENALKKL